MAESVVLCFVPEHGENNWETNDCIEVGKLQSMNDTKLRKSR